MRHRLFVLVAIVLALSGCASTKSKGASAPATSLAVTTSRPATTVVPAAVGSAGSAGDGVAIYKDHICLRAHVSTRKAQFETSVSLSVSSMAFVLGCQKSKSAALNAHQISWKEVDARVSTIMRKLLGQPF